MNIAFEHLAIPSPNPVGLRDWYVRVLGAREIFNNGQTPPTLLIALPDGGSIDAAKAELEKRGVRFTKEIRPAAGGGRVLFFEDGEGNLLHLVERPADF